MMEKHYIENSSNRGTHYYKQMENHVLHIYPEDFLVNILSDNYFEDKDMTLYKVINKETFDNLLYNILNKYFEV